MVAVLFSGLGLNLIQGRSLNPHDWPCRVNLNQDGNNVRQDTGNLTTPWNNEVGVRLLQKVILMLLAASRLPVYTGTLSLTDRER